jgi:hypothetical protein
MAMKSAMKRLIKGSGAQLGTALLIATAAAAQDNPGVPMDAAPLAGFGGVAGAAGIGGGFAGMGGTGPISDIRIVNAGAGIPVGGALLIYSGGGTATPPIVEVSDTATPNTTLGGTLTQFPGTVYWVWMPTAPLTADTTYQARLSAPDLGIVGVTTTFDAVAAISIAKPAIEASPSASWRGETNNWACCRTLIGSTLEDASCFPSEQRASIMLEPGFTTGDSAVLLNQFMFRLGNTELPVASAPLGIWPNVGTGPIYTQAEEYCFDLEAVEIVTGTVHTYADLQRCAPHGALADLGFIAIEPGATELDRVVCHAPPDQYKDEWCEMNEDPCADDAMETGCGLYGFVCEGDPLPPDPFATGGFAGMVGGSGAIGGGGMIGMAGVGGVTTGGVGGASGMAGDSDASVDEDDEDPPSSGGDSGCNASGAHDASGGGGALGYALGAAAVAWASRRRKRIMHA